MTRIESKHLVIPKTAGEVFDYLIDLKNVENLLPKDKISNFTADDKKFGFKITGAIPVELALVEAKPGELIQFKTTPGNSFQFTLDIYITDQGANCEVYQICNADINAFMKMMVEKPLSALFDYMVDRLLKVNQE
ncbi:MAG: hypothetical protein V4616_07770 [Bacteroidota bacterium]